MALDYLQEAIQVVECKDESDTVENESETKKVIRVIRKYKSRPSIEEILLNPDFKELPILVFSIAGKTRGGKSFLLNLMIKYLESKTERNWIAGVVPNCFSWKGGLDSVTRGLWICPKIYKLKSSDGSEVGIILLDNEGMFDGEATDGEIIAISGLSMGMSYLQMFNLKEKITQDYLENVVRNLVKGIEEMDSKEKEGMREYNLMFVVRDWIGEDKYDFGLKGGKTYIDDETQRGTEDNKQLWKEVLKTFSNVQCLLLPFPGIEAKKPQFTQTGNLSMLDDTFMREVKSFIETIFASENLKPPTTRLTGEGLYNILMKADGKVADESLSFMNVFTEHANFCKVEKLIISFQTKLPSVELDEGKSEVDNILNRANTTLIGKSAPQYLAQLKEAIEEMFNKKVMDDTFRQYKELLNMSGDIANDHVMYWPIILTKLHEYLCGEETTLEKSYKKASQIGARIYYEQLCKNYIKKFSEICVKTSLNKLPALVECTISNFRQCSDFGNLTGDDDFVYPVWLKNNLLLKYKVVQEYLKRVHTITGLSIQLLQELRRKQYEYFQAFTLLKKQDGDNWDRIQKKDEELLMKKIGYAMFGSPEPKIICETETGYSINQVNRIKSVSKQIISLSRTDLIKFSCAFITFQKCGVASVPLFRIENSEGNVNYIDTNCRVYEGWTDFIKTNTLPKLIYCYPVNGSYNKAHGFGVAFESTPASNPTSEVLLVTDKIANATSGIAGVAGVAALAAPVFGIALAPVVGGFAVIAGGVAGGYGAVRCGKKIWDKYKHNERVTTGDKLGMATNTFAVVGLGLFKFAKAAEGTVASLIRLAQSLTTFNAVVVVCSSDDTPSMSLLLKEISTHSLKILFYFNSKSSSDAIKVIQELLQLEDGCSTAQVLESLVNINSSDSVKEHNGVSEVKKFVSHGITLLVTSLLKTVRPEIKNVILLLEKIRYSYQSFRHEQINLCDMLKEVYGNMQTLLTNLKVENKNLRQKIKQAFFEKYDSDPGVNSMLDNLWSDNEGKLILVLRYLVCTVNSKIRKANHFYNTIEHEAIKLPGYDDEYHPLEEVTQQIKVLIEQNKSTVDLMADDNSVEYDDIEIVQQVLNVLLEHTKPNWKTKQFGKSLLVVFKKIMKLFDDYLQSYKDKVASQSNFNCVTLDQFFHKEGIQGNFGHQLLQNILCEFKNDGDLKEQSGNLDLVILPAWSEIMNHLYCYSTTHEVEKFDLVQQITKIDPPNYEKKNYENLCILLPGEDSLPTFFIFSAVDDNSECGLVWHDKDL